MKAKAAAMFFLAFLASSAAAQFVSPVPVVEAEIRDNTSIRMRSIELDRIKRDGKKKPVEKLGPAAVNNFLEIKEDFEKIQVLEGNIVTVYTRGKVIEYAKIAAFSAEISQSAARLKKNLFTPPTAAQTPDNSKPAETPLPDGVKNLIVELDSALGAFVNNPIFTASGKAKPKEKEKAQAALERLISLSEALKAEAEKQTQPKN